MLGVTGAWFFDSLLPAARHPRESHLGGSMASAHDRPRPVDVPFRGTGGTYLIHPLPCLDGVLLYVTLNGEAVGSWFGATEELAAEALAQRLIGAASHTYEGTST